MVIKDFVLFLESLKNKTYDKGCVMIYFQFPDFKKLASKVEEGDIYTEDGFGIESDPHVTLLYGLSPEVKLEQVIEKLDGISFGETKIGDVSLFEKDDYDVLKFSAFSPSLGVANKKLRELPYENDCPIYKPHLTLAYIKGGMGKKYVEMFKELEWGLEPSHLVFSRPGGEKIRIKISKEK